LKAFPKRAPFIKKAKASNEKPNKMRKARKRKNENEKIKELLMIFHRNDFAMNDSLAHHFFSSPPMQ
jgi:hypothetical protein